MIEKRFKYYRNNDGTSMVYDREQQEYYFCVDFNDICDILNNLYEENEQLKQDNTGLMRLLENQSIIIQELHSKLLEHQVKEPIVLTKEDLEVMGKAISYYTHGRCGE